MLRHDMTPGTIQRAWDGHRLTRPPVARRDCALRDEGSADPTLIALASGVSLKSLWPRNEFNPGKQLWRNKS